MRDYLDLSPVPIDEPCAQVGPDDYMPQNEGRVPGFCQSAWPDLSPMPWPLVLAFALSPTLTMPELTYQSKACFNDDDESQTEWAYTIEGELPSLWDDEARAELTAKGFECVPQETHDFWAQDWKESAR
jgi:hypothetical protein